MAVLYFQALAAIAAVALGPDGGRLGGAAADRQFRLGRYHLDFCGRPGRRRERIVAGRGRGAECAAMAGGGAGGDLVAAARDPYRDPHRRDHRRPALCRLRQGMGRQFAAPDVRLPAEPGAGIDPAGVCDFCRGALSRRRVAASGLSRRADPAGRHRRRGDGRCAAPALPRRSRQQGQGMRRRAVALVAPSELFLRMVRLAGLSRDRISIGDPLSYPWGLATLLAPVFMYWILVHVTGIPPLEAQMLRSRGERYRDYQSRTSVFFPLPPQKGVVT